MTDTLLVVGLRNPGAHYQGTRHNIGEEVVRAVADGTAFRKAPRRIPAEMAELDRDGKRLIVALPFAFMNDAGSPVAGLASYFKVERQALALIHDDIDLPFGKLRFQSGRGPGGHNGVASVIRAMGTDEMWRLKFGVGRPPGRQDPAAFVLKRFRRKEREDVALMIGAAADVVGVFVASGGRAANQEAGDATARLGIAG